MKTMVQLRAAYGKLLGRKTAEWSALDKIDNRVSTVMVVAFVGRDNENDDGALQGAPC